jgi:hypothetical protein
MDLLQVAELSMAASESGKWANAAAFASLGAAIAIPVGIQFGTAAFCMAAGPVALVAGTGATCAALYRRHWRSLIPSVFAILIGGLETSLLVVGIIRWSQTGVFPTR